MSIVPFDILTTVTTDSHKFSRGGSLVLILSGDSEQLDSATRCNASYDLRIGPQYRDYRDQDASDLADGQEVTLAPGSAFIFKTEEEIRLPISRFGYVVPKVGLLQKGISNTLSKVDPGYEGALIVTVFNLGGHLKS